MIKYVVYSTICLQLVFSFKISAQTVSEYEKAKAGTYIVTIDPRDLSKTINAKNNISDIQNILKGLKNEIKAAAKAFRIDPVHIAGAIAGEHALNVDAYDSLQQYARQANKYISVFADRTESRRDNLYQMVNSEEFADCNVKKSDYDMWYCVVQTWYATPGFQGRKFAFGTREYYKQFSQYFFDPNGVGATFGVGQMSPLRAMMVDDLVQQVKPSLGINFVKNGSIEDAFDRVLTPEKVVYYIAATVKFGMAAYSQIAKFDISSHPGVTATLYNVGQERIKASERYKENRNLLRSGSPLEQPRPNDVGRWVIQNLGMIKESIR